MEQKVQGLYKGLPLNIMAYTKEIFDALQSKEATVKINALFNYLRTGHESDLTKRENLVQFVKKCATRKIVDKIKSNSGVEETEEAYNKRISQEVYNTARITEKIRLGTDEKGDVHFYVKFGKEKDEYEINTDDTLTVVGQIYHQFIIEIEEHEKMPLEYILKTSSIKRITEDEQRKKENKLLKETLEEVELINCKLQQTLIDKEEITRQAEEDKTRRELEYQEDTDKLRNEIQMLWTSLHNKIEETDKQIADLNLQLQEQKLINENLQHNLQNVQEESRLTHENKVKRLIKLQEELEQLREENKTLQQALQSGNEEGGDNSILDMTSTLEEQEMITKELQQSLMVTEQEAKLAKEKYEKKETQHKAALQAKQTKLQNLIASFQCQKRKQKEAIQTIKNKFLQQKEENCSLQKILGNLKTNLLNVEEEKVQNEEVLKKTQKEVETLKSTVFPKPEDNKEVANLKQALEEQEQITLEMQQSLFDSQQENTLLREEKIFREKELEDDNAKLQAEIQELKNSLMQAVLNNHQQGDDPLKILLEQLKLQSQ